MRQWGGESVANGRYAIGDVVGRGRRSRVHAGYDRVLRRPVAVKFLPAEDGPTARWRTEAAALDRFDHAHIVRLLDGGEAGDDAFLVLPLMTETLAGRISRATLSRDHAANVVLGLADALGHVHRAGLVHGEVDADGVLLDDVGVARWGGLPDPTATAARRAVDQDLHALAVLAVRCVTGDRSGRSAPSAVLDAIRTASAAGQHLPGLRRRMACSLESVALVPARRAERVVDVARRFRPRGRPGFAAVLAAGFAASVLGSIVVAGGTLRPDTGDELAVTAPVAVLAEPSGSDVVSSVQGALDRLGSLAAEPPPAPAETREPPVARVAEDRGDSADRTSRPPRSTTREDEQPPRSSEEARPDRGDTATDGTRHTRDRSDRGRKTDDEASDESHGGGLPGLVRHVLHGLS